MKLSRIRVRKTKDYSVVANGFFKDKNLSFKAKGFLGLVMTLPDTWDFTIKGILEVSKDSEDTVRTIIDELIKKGYCMRTTERTAKGTFKGWSYTFSEKVNNDWINPFRENPQMDNPNVVKPDTEKPAQINTDNNKVLNKEIKNKEERESLSLPFSSDKFKSLWGTLLGQPKWKHKGISSIKMNLKRLSNYPEDFAIELVEAAIAGEWLGVVFDDTPQKFEEWQKRHKEDTRKITSLEQLRNGK